MNDHFYILSHHGFSDIFIGNENAGYRVAQFDEMVHYRHLESILCVEHGLYEKADKLMRLVIDLMIFRLQKKHC